MNVEEFRAYCLTKKGVTETFPFDEVTLVLKVADKMFALLSLDGDNTAALKCNPEWAIDLREEYAAITPGYHMNKKHWNTIHLNDLNKNSLIKEMIDHSYDLVVAGLPKRVREEIINL